MAELLNTWLKDVLEICYLSVFEKAIKALVHELEPKKMGIWHKRMGKT